MKKQIKKLTLNRETLRDLDENRLHEVAGGVPSHKYTNCGSCGIACTVIDCTA